MISFFVFAQILEVVKSVDRNSFNINNLVMNLKYTFINKQTKEVHFIYQPIMSQKISSNLASFLYDVAYSTRLALNEDIKPINELLAYIRSLNVVSVLPLENYILKVYPQIYKQVKDKSRDRAKCSPVRMCIIAETSGMKRREILLTETQHHC